MTFITSNTLPPRQRHAFTPMLAPLLLSATAAATPTVRSTRAEEIVVVEDCSLLQMPIEAPDSAHDENFVTVDEDALAEYLSARGENLDDLLERGGRILSGPWPLDRPRGEARGREAVVRAELDSEPE